MRFTGPDGKEHEGAKLIQVSNNTCDLSGVGRSASRARLDTGVLGLPKSASGLAAAALADLEPRGTVGSLFRTIAGRGIED